MRKTRRFISILLLITISVTILSGCSADDVANSAANSVSKIVAKKAIDQIKNSKCTEDSDATYSDIVENYMSDTNWFEFSAADNDQIIIEVDGKSKFDGNKDMVLQFAYGKDVTTVDDIKADTKFSLYYASVAKQAYDTDDVLEIMYNQYVNGEGTILGN